MDKLILYKVIPNLFEKHFQTHYVMLLCCTDGEQHKLCYVYQIKCAPQTVEYIMVVVVHFIF